MPWVCNPGPSETLLFYEQESLASDRKDIAGRVLCVYTLYILTYTMTGPRLESNRLTLKTMLLLATCAVQYNIHLPHVAIQI